MPEVELRPNHPIGTYRRGGHIFTAGEKQDIPEDDEGYELIFNDEWLLVDGKRLAERQPDEPDDAGDNAEETEQKQQGKEDEEKTKKDGNQGAGQSAPASGPTNTPSVQTKPADQASS